MDTNENPIEKVHAGLSPRIAMVICIGGIIITGLMSGGYHYIYSLVK
jgi:NADH-quinone oxidoreductase subunit N